MRYHATSEIGHGLAACRVDNPLAKVCGLSHSTGSAVSLTCLSKTARVTVELQWLEHFWDHEN